MVADFDARHAGERVADMTVRGVDSAILFTDGRFGALDPVVDDFAAGQVKEEKGSGQAVEFLDPGSELLVLRADGRAALYDSENAWDAGWVLWARVFEEAPTSVPNPVPEWRVWDSSTKKGFVRGSRMMFAFCTPTCTKEGDGGAEPVAWLVGRDGRASYVAKHRFASSHPYERRMANYPPKFPRGTRLVAFEPLSWSSLGVFLRSDGRLVYRGRGDSASVKREAQPPAPASGLHYTDVDAHSFGGITLLRSDGQLVAVDPGVFDPGGGRTWPTNPSTGPRAPRGWKFLSPHHFRLSGSQSGDLAQLYVIEKIRSGDPVPSGIKVAKASKRAEQGKVINLKVKVVSRANLRGGKVVVTTARGKTVGRVMVANANGEATVTVKTRTLKARKTPHILTVQYLGNPTSKKSGKATMRLHVTRDKRKAASYLRVPHWNGV
ncbi:MAG: hypothetical protein FWD59_08500 [Micrococcales bacterium]|nr:hypothetical protein [Micrococcales bacterium]